MPESPETPASRHTESDEPCENNTDTASKTPEAERRYFTHSEWEYDDCPECGNHVMDVVQVSTETYKYETGDEEYLSPGAYVEPVKVECRNCNELLLRHPAMDLLNAV